jgi:hypothetical protein
VSNEEQAEGNAPDSSLSVSDSAHDIAFINRRIDDIVAFQKRREPWYRDTGVLISVAAFFISVVTSVITAYRTHQQDINSRKDALHTVIQQYNATQLHSVEMQLAFLTFARDKSSGPLYEMSQNLSAAATGTAGLATALLSKQAYSLVRQLGSNASSIDLGEVASILYYNGQFALSENIYKDAVSFSENAFEYIGALRGLAQTQFALGKKKSSEETMTKALEAFTGVYPNEADNQDYVNYTQVGTYIWWIGFVGTSDCELSKDNLAKSVEIISHTPVALNAVLQQQIAKPTAVIADCH